MSSNFFTRVLLTRSHLSETDLSSQWLSRCPASSEFTLTTEEPQVFLSSRLMTPAPPLAPGTKCPCKEEVDPYGVHLTSTCSRDGSLHSTHSAVLGTTAQAGRHFGYKVELEVSHHLQGSDSDSHKRPGTKTTSWSQGEVTMDLAVCSPVSVATQLSLAAASDPGRLARKLSLILITHKQTS